MRAVVSGQIKRPVYKLSVIPGGAYNSGELRQALDSDGVAARHYALFRRANLRTEPSHIAKPVYVSYRVADRVYWTRRPIYLKPGEVLLTDGTNYARARCGNRVEVNPQLPVEAKAPSPEELERPVAAAPEPVLPAGHGAPLLPEVFLPFPLETGARVAAMMPAIIGGNQPLIGFGLPPSSGSLMPFPVNHPNTPPSTPPPPIQPPPIPNLPPIVPSGPPECCFIVVPLAPPLTPPNTSPYDPPFAPPLTPPYITPVVLPSTPPWTPTAIQPSGSPLFPPYSLPGDPPFTPPKTPPNTPPEVPPPSPPNGPPDTSPLFPTGSPQATPTPEPDSWLLTVSALGILAGAACVRQAATRRRGGLFCAGQQ